MYNYAVVSQELSTLKKVTRYIYKPTVQIQNVTSSFTSFGEVKAANVPMAIQTTAGVNTVNQGYDTNAIIQAMTEAMVMAEVAEFPNETVPTFWQTILYSASRHPLPKF